MSITDIGSHVVSFGNDESWVEFRKHFIGASEAPILYGIGYAGTNTFSLFTEKVTGRGKEFSRESLRTMKLGSLAEPVIREWFRDETGLDVWSPPEDGKVVHLHPQYHFIGATLDGATLHGGVKIPIELKRVGYSQVKDWRDGPPQKFRVQVQHQMLVTDTPAAYIVGMLNEEELHIHLEERDDEFLATHLEVCKDFWSMVEAREYRGSIDGSEATTEAIKMLYPTADPSKVIELGIEADDLAEEIEKQTAFLKPIEEAAEEAKNRIKMLLGDAIEGQSPSGRRITYKNIEVKEKVVPGYNYRRLNIGKLPKK